MYVNQSIQRPHGVTAFGSALIRVDPDYSSLRFAVSRIAAKPKDAFDEARRGSDAVRAALNAMKIDPRDVRSGDLSLAEEWTGYNETRRMIGYRATASFHAFVRDFSKVEPVLVAVVDAGADRVHSVHHKTTRMREIRDEARKRAVTAARAKAETYAAAAGAKLGVVIHIEDVNPDDLARRSHMPEVAGAVMVCFALTI